MCKPLHLYPNGTIQDENGLNRQTKGGCTEHQNIQGGREISVIILTDDYLCYMEPKIPFNFFLILIFNELLKFKTSDE